MRRKIVFLFCIISLLAISNPVFADELPTINAKSYILVDTISGEILAAKNANEPRPPASMTKMMSAIVIFDQIKQRVVKWDDVVTVSKRAAAINEAEIHLVEGEKQTVKQLFTALFVQSANDATVALAEHIAGTEEGFVELMNKKASEMGLKNTHFQNSTGLNTESYPDPPATSKVGQHEMSAYDTAIVAQFLLKNYPEVLQYTSIPTYTFHQNQPNQQKVDNWDLMLPSLKYYYQGVDGLKTGHTNAAGYCFTSTADRSGLRVVSVVMGTDSEFARFHETKKLLDYTYDNFELATAIRKGKVIPGHDRITLPNGVERTVAVAPEYSLQLAEKKADKESYTYKVVLKKGIQAPISKGTVIGEVSLLYKGKPIPGVQSVPLVAQKTVEKGSAFRLFFRHAWDTVNSWIN
ncbi:D-alanyl-D-alanine carboxypeptidase [Shimazuella sp. AN120528]|uniref:D-alanyl-D-alanine carboxypeptidase family protein n=1 Tax=Shimazuella soli TaxID=1892854 RepID=UPI001F0F1EB8|nr:D-alanyl-D-alanine carboxypeptidase family protein [Shimazuella soli]MCH5585026.1 D-alanyl-D-alanine carboxypeptidase [Shimazuella soli]